VESYLPISYLNDFIFCPRSIYFHQLYGKVDTRLYQTTDQVNGKAAHKTLDSKTYTTAKVVLQTIEVFSDKYKIGGKIDSYDQQKKRLVERKRKITTIYDGYIYQLYAQYHCLTEMGYQVESLKLYSLMDNKSYPIAKPEDDPARQQGFERLIDDMSRFKLIDPQTPNKNKCERCIYSPMCDVSLC
jgi:CRISPR-associated exonuclease Cas4